MDLKRSDFSDSRDHNGVPKTPKKTGLAFSFYVTFLLFVVFVLFAAVLIDFKILRSLNCVDALWHCLCFNKFLGRLDKITSGFFRPPSCEYTLAVFCFCIAILYRNQ